MAAQVTRETPVRGPDTATAASLTTAILAVNIAIFIWEVVAAKSADALMGVPTRVTLAFGANFAPLTLGLGQYDRLIAACFLHGSALHVGLNMWSFRQIGPFVERSVGSARFAVLYLLSGIASSLASVGWGLYRGAPVPSVGASGAICGVLAAAFILSVRLEGWKSPVARQIGFWLVMILAYGATIKNIDNAAHIGGLIAGALIAVFWKRVVYSPAATTLCLVVFTAVCLWAGAAVAYRDVTDPFANVAPNERSNLVVVALGVGDCEGARRALMATQAVAPGAPELRGLRTEVQRACPDDAP